MIGNLETLSNLNIISIDRNVEYATLQKIAEKIKESFADIIKQTNIGTLKNPFLEDINIDSIDTFLLTMILNQSYPNSHTLGITSAELTTKDQDAPYGIVTGGKNPRNDVAVISTKRLASRKNPEYNLLIDRTAKVAIHEVGHNLGLTDHRDFQSAKDGNLCPMSKGELNKFGYEGYVKAVIDQRGLILCDDCKRFLRQVYKV